MVPLAKRRDACPGEGMGRTLVRAVGVLAAWLAGVVVVRLGLAWADTHPYSRASEVRYGLVATVALSAAISGTIIALRWRRSGS
jgi:hypothetical protein